MVTPRQDRSRTARAALLRAAVELLAEGGARAITHRAVASRAGVAAASTSYYFDSIQDLADQALAAHVADRAAELHAVVALAAVGDGGIEAFADRLATSLVDRSEGDVVAQFEVYLEAWRNPGLRTVVQDALDGFEGLAAEGLRTLGVGDPVAWAPAFVALIDGFALHRVARPRARAVELAALRDSLLSLFAAARG